MSTAIARGDLSRKITVDVRGEILQLKETINTMVDQLNSFAAEVTRVAREVGTEGKLGGQAIVPGVDGVMKDIHPGQRSSRAHWRIWSHACASTQVPMGTIRPVSSARSMKS